MTINPTQPTISDLENRVLRQGDELNQLKENYKKAKFYIGAIGLALTIVTGTAIYTIPLEIEKKIKEILNGSAVRKLEVEIRNIRKTVEEDFNAIKGFAKEVPEVIKQKDTLKAHAVDLQNDIKQTETILCQYSMQEAEICQETKAQQLRLDGAVFTLRTEGVYGRDRDRVLLTVNEPLCKAGNSLIREGTTLKIARGEIIECSGGGKYVVTVLEIRDDGCVKVAVRKEIEKCT